MFSNSFAITPNFLGRQERECDDLDYRLWLFCLQPTPNVYRDQVILRGDIRFIPGPPLFLTKVKTHLDFEYADRRVSTICLTSDYLIVGFHDGQIRVLDSDTLQTRYRLYNIRKSITTLCTVFGTPHALTLSTRLSGTEKILVAAGGNTAYYWPIGLRDNPYLEARLIKSCETNILTIGDTLLGPLLITENGKIFRINTDANRFVGTELLCHVPELFDHCRILRITGFIVWDETVGVMLLFTRYNWMSVVRLSRSPYGDFKADILFKKYIKDFQRMPEIQIALSKQFLFVTSPKATIDCLDKETCLYKFRLMDLLTSDDKAVKYHLKGGQITSLQIEDDFLTTINSERVVQIFRINPFQQLYMIKMDGTMSFASVMRKRIVIYHNTGQLSVHRLPTRKTNTVENCCFACLVQYDFLFKNLRNNNVSCVCSHRIN